MGTAGGRVAQAGHVFVFVEKELAGADVRQACEQVAEPWRAAGCS